MSPLLRVHWVDGDGMHLNQEIMRLQGRNRDLDVQQAGRIIRRKIGVVAHSPHQRRALVHAPPPSGSNRLSGQPDRPSVDPHPDDLVGRHTVVDPVVEQRRAGQLQQPPSPGPFHAVHYPRARGGAPGSARWGSVA